VPQLDAVPGRVGAHRGGRVGPAAQDARGDHEAVRRLDRRLQLGGRGAQLGAGARDRDAVEWADQRTLAEDGRDDLDASVDVDRGGAAGRRARCGCRGEPAARGEDRPGVAQVAELRDRVRGPDVGGPRRRDGDRVGTERGGETTGQDEHCRRVHDRRGRPDRAGERQRVHEHRQPAHRVEDPARAELDLLGRVDGEHEAAAARGACPGVVERPRGGHPRRVDVGVDRRRRLVRVQLVRDRGGRLVDRPFAEMLERQVDHHAGVATGRGRDDGRVASGAQLAVVEVDAERDEVAAAGDVDAERGLLGQLPAGIEAGQWTDEAPPGGEAVWVDRTAQHAARRPA